MSPPLRHPLYGKPRTLLRRLRDGTPRYIVIPHVLTPERAKLADWLASMLGTALLLTVIAAFVFSREKTWPYALTLLALFLIGRALIRAILPMLLRARTEIEMTTEQIKVRRWLWWTRYDRLIEHRFALQWHDRADDESRRQDYERRREGQNGRVPRQTPYYNCSLHVVLIYAGQRVDLLTVYGQKEAAAIVARLQYCDRALNAALSMNGGNRQRPEDEWADVPGGMRHG